MEMRHFYIDRTITIILLLLRETRIIFFFFNNNRYLNVRTQMYDLSRQIMRIGFPRSVKIFAKISRALFHARITCIKVKSLGIIGSEACCTLVKGKRSTSKVACQSFCNRESASKISETLAELSKKRKSPRTNTQTIKERS